MNLLHTLGLMTRKEHERRLRDAVFGTMTVEVHKELIAVERAKFKRAATDLAAQAEEIAAYKEGAKALHRGLDDYMATIRAQEAEIDSLRPDALAMRRKRQMDRDRVAGKRGVA